MSTSVLAQAFHSAPAPDSPQGTKVPRVGSVESGNYGIFRCVGGDPSVGLIGQSSSPSPSALSTRLMGLARPYLEAREESRMRSPTCRGSEASK